GHQFAARHHRVDFGRSRPEKNEARNYGSGRNGNDPGRLRLRHCRYDSGRAVFYRVPGVLRYYGRGHRWRLVTERKLTSRQLTFEKSMAVRITCPHCNQDLRLPEELYEGPAQCPKCRGAFAMRWRQGRERAAAPMAPRRPMPVDRKPCPFCGEPIK